MTVHILGGDIHLIDLKTRMPFRYGIATMTEAPQAFVRLQVEINGVQECGISADLLPPKWFTKDPARPIDEEIDEMLLVIEHALTAATGMKADSVFDAWRQLWEEQARWGRENSYPPLLTHFGTSLVERALIEAFCRRCRHPFRTLFLQNAFGIRLEDLHSSLKGCTPQDAQNRQGAGILVRHTVGLADPLVEEDIPPGERLDDGLPQSLVSCIEAYGLWRFKIKLSGDLEHDRNRLRRIISLLQEHVRDHPNYCFSLDGNEYFRSVEAFRDYWEKLKSDVRLKRVGRKILFVEQPFHRDVALDPAVMGPLQGWRGRPRMIIDESDGDLTSVPQALALGYRGCSYKNCKGVFKGIANACQVRRRRHNIVSGEDLANIGPVALLQDLAVCDALRIDDVERNGHHYFAGLSAFPEEVQEQMLRDHRDLYRRGRAGWPTLQINDGELAVASIVRAPFGVKPRINVELFTPLAKWCRRRSSLLRRRTP